MTREEAVPGVLGDDANRQRERRIGAGAAVLHEQLAPGEVREQIALEQRRNCAGSIGRLTLPHATRRAVAAVRTMNLSFGERPVCGAGAADERPVGGDHAFAAPDRLLVEHGRRRFQWTRAGLDPVGAKIAAGERLDAGRCGGLGCHRARPRPRAEARC